MESAAACSSWPLVYILFQISAKKSARKNRILIKEETLAEIFFHQRSRKFFKSASQKGLTSIRCCSFFVAKFAILPGPSYSCEFLVIFETEFTWELWGSLEKLQWMWLNWVRTGLETERSFNIFQGKGCVLPICQSMSKKTAVSFEGPFPYPSGLPSHVEQLLSTAYILHKTYVLRQLSKKTEPIYCSLNLLSIWPCTYLQLTLNYMSRAFSISGSFCEQCIC